MSKNVPKLRFPGFTGEWEDKKLGDVCTLITKGTSPQKYDEASDINFIKIESIKNGSIEIDKCKKISTAVYEGELKRSKLNKGDILYGIAGSLGVTALVDDRHIPANTNQALAILRGKTDLNRDYVMQVLNSSASKRFIYENVSIGAQPNISLEQMGSFRIPYPTLPEQAKIADFLSIFDSRIANQSFKLDSLQALKKGLMQKLFSQEIRFKMEDESEYPEWEEQTISTLGTFYNGLSGKTKEDFVEGNGRFITYMNVFSNSIAKIDILGSVDIKIGEKQNSVKFGDILFTQSSETVEEVGMSSAWMHNEEVYLNSFCFGFRPNSIDFTTPSYLAYVLRSDMVRKRIMNEGQGSTRFNLSSSRLGKVSIPVPTNKEQQKIATFLSTIDEKIEIEKDILGVLTELKKGLLQQMFV